MNKRTFPSCLTCSSATRWEKYVSEESEPGQDQGKVVGSWALPQWKRWFLSRRAGRHNSSEVHIGPFLGLVLIGFFSYTIYPAASFGEPYGLLLLEAREQCLESFHWGGSEDYLFKLDPALWLMRNVGCKSELERDPTSPSARKGRQHSLPRAVRKPTSRGWQALALDEEFLGRPP